ncbi:MAG: GNAT family N-acetyltransferase [Ilumatobacter sp.]|nr:GNAT family N-acetyltransferase [Ilumatobacter sp.]
MPDWWARRPGRVVASSDRLLLTPQRRSDWSDMAEAFDDDELLDWQGWTPEHAALQAYSARHDPPRSFRGFPANLTVRLKGTREYVGTYSIHWVGLDLFATEATLGWWIANRHQGQGLGTESLRLVLAALTQRSDLETVRIGTRSDNVRALGQLAAVGAELVEEAPTPLPNGTSPMGKWYVVRLSP